MNGLLETLLWRAGEVQFVNEHLERMLRSADEMGAPRPDEGSVRKAIAGLERPEVDECAIRVEWSGADEWMLTVEAFPIPPLTLDRRDGCRLVSLPVSYRSAHAQWKTTERTYHIRGLAYATMRGGNEGLFIDEEGRALEGTVSNVFLVESGRIVRTAPPDGSILPGILRAEVIRRLRHSGVLVVEERFDTALLRQVPSFVTSSLTLVAPVVWFDGVEVPQSPPGSELRRILSTI